MACKFPVLGNLFACLALSLIYIQSANAQMREIYSNPLAGVGAVQKLDFYSPAEGYAAFEDAIGLTVDSGDTFVRFIYITSANVNFGSFGVDPLSKFTIRGVKAYDRNNLLVYGGYPKASAILQSSDGGNTFSIVLATWDDDFLSHKGDVSDMIVLRERNLTLAVDPEHIYRSRNKGITWDTIQFIPDAYLTNLDGFYNGHIYAWSKTHPQNYIYRSGIDGALFSPVTIPGGTLRAASFINADEGYINVNGPAAPETYYTNDAGSNWYPKSYSGRPSPSMNQLKFVTAGTGYALVNRNDTYQTRDSAQTWEKIPRQNFFFPPQDLTLNTLFTFNGSQLWTGGENSLIELNTTLNNPAVPDKHLPVVRSVSPARGFAGTPVTIKGAHFSGTVSVSIGSVNVPNYAVVSDSVITAVIAAGNNGEVSVTNSSGAAIDGPSFYYPALPVIQSFSPMIGGEGTRVMVKGANMFDVKSITVGGVAIQSFYSDMNFGFEITVGKGASGKIVFSTPDTSVSTVDSFEFVQMPVIRSFSPATASAGVVVTITGSGFHNTAKIYFGNVMASQVIVVSDSVITAMVSTGASGDVRVETAGGEISKPGFIFISPSVPDTCGLTVNIIPGRDSLCSGNQLVFTAMPDRTYSNATYQWLINNKTTNIASTVFRWPLLKTGDKIYTVLSAITACGLKQDTSNAITIGTVNNSQYSVVIASGTIDQCNTSSRSLIAGAIGGSGLAAGNGFLSGSYHWKLNGQPVGNNDDSLSLTNLKTGDVIWLMYLLNTPCKADTVLSNRIVITVSNRVKPTAVVTGNNQLERGAETIIKAEVQYHGISVKYQWQDSTSAHSWNLIAGTTTQSIRYFPVATGDKLRCLIIIEDSCGFSDTLTTAPLVFKITDGVNPMANLPVRAYPNPVGNSLILDNINPADNWQSFELLGPDGHQHIIIKDIRNRTNLTVSLANLPRGLYFVQFKRATGEKAFLRIMKL